jgi:hypothetical protein
MVKFRKILLTFDVEDFINPNAISALYRILQILEKYKIKAIFFITGHMAEKISNYPRILELLKNHLIGYHSSSHSVRPTIPEYTDVKDFEKAYEASIQRETSHINPTTGKTEREGGIFFLQELFMPQQIQAFRAPGMCWTPSNLEALRDLSIRYDFSSSLAFSEPVCYRGLTFYPFTILQEWHGTSYDYECLLSSISRRKITVLDLHPTLLVNKVEWDSIYYRGNPNTLSKVPKRPKKEAERLFYKLELLIKRIKTLEKAKIVDTYPTLNKSNEVLKLTRKKIDCCYEKSVQWVIKRFNYYPKHIKNQFYEFFNDLCQ